MLSKVRSILIQSSLSHRYWGEALIAAVYIYNRTPHSALEGFITLYEARYNEKPDISAIKTWGYKAYKRIPLEGLNKLQPRAIIGTLIGYGNNQYKITNPTNHKTSWVRDVYILENEYIPSNEQGQELDIDSDLETDVDTVHKTVDLEKNESDWYDKFMNQVTEYASEDIALPAIIEPITFQQAQKDTNSERWQQAMRQELNELQNQKTWELVELPPNRKVLKGRWVYKIKNPPNKTPVYKARWVAKGFQQRLGVDFSETFANTANPTTYRLLLAIATEKDWEIE